MSDALEKELVAALRSRNVRRLCEINAQSLASVRSTLAALQHIKHYTAITFEGEAWHSDDRRLRFLRATPAYTVRAKDVEQSLGVCDAIIIRHEAPTAAARTALLLELTVLLQHASAQSLIAMRAVDCASRPPGLYSGPFWMFNLTEPCATERFQSLGTAGTLTNVKCTAGPGPAHEVLCMGMYAEQASACARQVPLLERWNGLALGVGSASSAGGAPHLCAVRKQDVRVAASSWLWTKATHARSTLTHLFRRHLRYYSALACDEDGIEKVCLLFKDEVMEEFVAGLTSADGLSFDGDPALVMPKLTLRSQALPKGLSSQPLALPIARRARRMAAAAAAAAAAANVAVSVDDTAWRNLSFDEVVHRARGHKGELGAAMSQRARYLRNVSSRVRMLGASMTHNLALTRLESGEWFAVGGRHNKLSDRFTFNSPLLLPKAAATLTQRFGFSPSRFDAPRNGLWMVRGRSWRFDGRPPADSAVGESRPWLSPYGGVDEPETTQWQHKHLILDGRHPGCVERRDVRARADFAKYLYEGGVCEYDGRLSLVHFGGEFLLYARANLAASGRRHVQVTRSRDPYRGRDLTARPSFGLAPEGAPNVELAAEPAIEAGTGGPRTLRASEASGSSSSWASSWAPFETIRIDGYDETGDVYFFGVQANPSHNGSLVAVFPLVHRLRACLAIAASVDGVRWTRVTPLLSCRLYGERTMDHPAAPSMVRRGSEIWLYVQEEVPGITVERTTPMATHTQLLKSEKPSRVVRYTFPCLLLAHWTEGALRRLRGSQKKRDGKEPTPFVHTCGEHGGGDRHNAAEAGAAAAAPRKGDAKSCSWIARGGAGLRRDET